MVTVAVQWYQSHDTVTASLQLKPLPPHTNDDVVLHLEEQYCSILIAGVYEYYTKYTGVTTEQDASFRKDVLYILHCDTMPSTSKPILI